MSYVRFSELSDVYVFSSTVGLECCGCLLTGFCYTAHATIDMVGHLLEHKSKDHLLPDDLIHNIEIDDIYNFGEYRNNDDEIMSAMRLGEYHG